VSTSRPRPDSGSHRSTIRSFGELSRFLGGSREDAESQLISDGMRQLAQRVERIVETLRATQQRTVVAPLLVDCSRCCAAIATRSSTWHAVARPL